MRNILLIARREYLEQIRGRAFRISTIGLPALFAVIVGIMLLCQPRPQAASKHMVIASTDAALANAGARPAAERQGRQVHRGRGGARQARGPRRA